MKKFRSSFLLLSLLCGCATHDGPVTITRTLHVGIYNSCLSAGVGVMLCEHIQFDPKSCAIVIIYPKPPSAGLRGALDRLAHQTQAMCLNGESK